MGGAATDAPLSLLMSSAPNSARACSPTIQRRIRDELGSRGWSSVEALPAQVVARTLTETEIMASEEPSTLLASIIESLQALKLAADTRAAHVAHAASGRGERSRSRRSRRPATTNTS